MRVTTGGDATLLLIAQPLVHTTSIAAPCTTRDLRSPGVFASLSLSVGGGGGGAREAVLEPRSGRAFPATFCLDSNAAWPGACPRITGTGVRSKRIAGVKNVDRACARERAGWVACPLAAPPPPPPPLAVYAMALYVDEGGARSLRAKFPGAKAEALAQDPAALFDGGWERGGGGRPTRLPQPHSSLAARSAAAARRR